MAAEVLGPFLAKEKGISMVLTNEEAPKAENIIFQASYLSIECKALG